jgi:hypothetical protein
LRQGAYLDSWGVRAVIPEAVLAKELGARALLAGRYRFYAQSSADFCQPVYTDIEEFLSGDPRLGSLREHAVGAEARFTILGAYRRAGSLSVLVGYEWSRLDYRVLHSDDVIAQIFTLAVDAVY